MKSPCPLQANPGSRLPWGVSGNAAFASDERLAGIYNGLGPDSFPRWLRAVLTDLNPLLRPVAFIHDIEWHESDGSKDSLVESNRR